MNFFGDVTSLLPLILLLLIVLLLVVCCCGVCTCSTGAYDNFLKFSQEVHKKMWDTVGKEEEARWRRKKS